MSHRLELLARIEHVARRDPTHPAYLDPGSGRSLSYLELHEQIHAPAPSPTTPAASLLKAGNTIAFAPRLLSLLARGHHALLASPSASDAEVEAQFARLRAAPPPTNSPAVLLASSGSTGLPKLVRRTAHSLDLVASAMAASIPVEPHDRVLAAVPLAHSYGLEHGLLLPLWVGATVVLCDGITPVPLAQALTLGVTVFPAVPAMIEALASAEVTGLQHLRLAYSAGGHLPAEVKARFESRYHLAIGQVYGSTEIGTVTFGTGNTPSDHVGHLLPGVSALTTPDGELAVRSPWMLEQYIGDELPLADGHYLTGDLGTVTPDSTVRLAGRRKLLIDAGGLKVNPLEVEDVLTAHPAVRECAVVALPQTETVSRVRAVVVLEPGQAPTADDLRSWVRTRLAPHKVPRVVDFVDRLPRSPTGKLLRHALHVGGTS